MASRPERISRIPLPGPLASARARPWPLLGRESEVEAIAAAWSRVTAGARETVLVAGEPGAGKSRLAAETGHDAHRDGGLVLYGSGEEKAGRPTRRSSRRSPTSIAMLAAGRSSRICAARRSDG